jgi:hypothetical protein
MIGMIDQGGKNGLLTAPEVERIKAQVKEPYIQKYLKSLAVHAATLFVSETVFLVAAVVYVLAHPELTWQAATLRAGLIIGALNLLPVSPGSLVRGFYVVGLMIKERNFKDYNIALGVSFLKVFGYLAFPIQMTYRYPDLARFMAGHWANEAVHRVPVFGEKGAWLEHFVFDAFYNFPLTLRRRIRTRAERRAGEPKKILDDAAPRPGCGRRPGRPGGRLRGRRRGGAVVQPDLGLGGLGAGAGRGGDRPGGLRLSNRGARPSGNDRRRASRGVRRPRLPYRGPRPVFRRGRRRGKRSPGLGRGQVGSHTDAAVRRPWSRRRALRRNAPSLNRADQNRYSSPKTGRIGACGTMSCLFSTRFQ